MNATWLRADEKFNVGGEWKSCARPYKRIQSCGILLVRQRPHCGCGLLANPTEDNLLRNASKRLYLIT